MNRWLTHLIKFKRTHPNLSFGECMIQAKKTYKKKV